MKKFLPLFCLLLPALAFSCSAPREHEINVATYNIRLDVASDTKKGDGWIHRRHAIPPLVMFHDFDLFGMQEVLHDQLTDLLAGLPDYTYIGVGRADGRQAGEYSPVFYKKDKFKLLASDTFWLSEQTDTPGKGWDAAYERICTWGHFEEAETGFRFYAFNLHMDHIGAVARRNSTELVLSQVRTISNGAPAILMGDFNFDQTHANYRIIAGSDILGDSYELAGVRYANNGTFNEFDPNKFTLSRIDHIFVTNGFTVDRYGVLTDSYRQVEEGIGLIKADGQPADIYYPQSRCRLPSDHFPVMVKLVYKK